MLSRRKFVISSSVGAVLMVLGAPRLLPRALAATNVAPLPVAPAPFVALADQLSGQIGVDRELIDYLHQKLLPVLPGLDGLVDKLALALPKVAGITDPAQRLQVLAGEGDGLKDLFLRINTALYLGTVDNRDGQRECIGFESVAAYQAVAEFVQPPSYCTGSPNFWVNPPATHKESVAHV